MSDDLDALLARADRNADRPGGLIRDLAAAVRTLRTERDTALDVIARLRDGEYVMGDVRGDWWGCPDVDGEQLGPFVTDAEREVLRRASERL